MHHSHNHQLVLETLSKIHSCIPLIKQVALVGHVLSNLDLELFLSKLRGLVLLLPASNPTLVGPGLTVGGDQTASGQP